MPPSVGGGFIGAIAGQSNERIFEPAGSDLDVMGCGLVQESSGHRVGVTRMDETVSPRISTSSTPGMARSDHLVRIGTKSPVWSDLRPGP